MIVLLDIFLLTKKAIFTTFYWKLFITISPPCFRFFIPKYLCVLSFCYKVSFLEQRPLIAQETLLTLKAPANRCCLVCEKISDIKKCYSITSKKSFNIQKRYSGMSEKDIAQCQQKMIFTNDSKRYRWMSKSDSHRKWEILRQMSKNNIREYYLEGISLRWPILNFDIADIFDLPKTESIKKNILPR